jgi:isoquinoline 1-oxidoreductase alpha subunit
MIYRFNLNGKPRTVDVQPDMPLLWVLRDVIGLTGTKFGCGQGICGACTVHLNGAAIRSCVTSMSSIQDQNIITIEGLSNDGRHVLQQAWVELDVPQCGYCQAGQIMSAASLLAGNENPSNEQIEEAMAGNICRCATYVRIRRAIQRAIELRRER